MNVSMMVAHAKNMVIGSDNRLPWHLPDELKYFKNTTMGHHIIMGRKNYEAIGRALPGRTTIVVTRNKDLNFDGVLMAQSVDEAIELAIERGDTEPFITGGGEIYAASLDKIQRLYVTIVDYNPAGDVYFPSYDHLDWQEVSSEFHPADDRHPYAFEKKILIRKS